MNNKFTVGQELSEASLCDSECIFKGTVLRRTAKFVTVHSMGEDRRVKIHTDDEGNEFCYPYGQYSMCTRFKA